MRGAVSVALVYVHFDRQEQVGRPVDCSQRCGWGAMRGPLKLQHRLCILV